MTASPPHHPPPISPAASAVTGEVIRRYRRLIGLSQEEFSRRWGLTQGAMSQIESGRLAVSEGRAAELLVQFTGRNGELPASKFLEQFSKDRRQSLPLLGHPSATHTTLTVWRWRDDFDLAAEPIGLEPAGLVTLTLPHAARAVALQLPDPDPKQPGEILVFIPVEYERLRSDDLVLIQPAATGTGPTSAAIATVVSIGRGTGGGGGGSGGRTRFKPLTPMGSKPREIRSTDLAGLLRCIYRAQYVP